MKHLKLLCTGLLCLVVVLGQGCALINRVRAKNQLNEGAVAYKAGKYSEAEEHFLKAQQLDPNQKNAQFFIARSLHSQFRPGLNNSANLDKAKRAIAEYQKVLDNDPNNDEAFTAVAFLYNALKDEQQATDWIQKRADMPNAAPEKRADAFTLLASKSWDCSYKITEEPENKKIEKKGDKDVVTSIKPKSEEDYKKIQQCVATGSEQANKAIELNPENPNAWSYKTNLLLEAAKLAEMDGNIKARDDYRKEAETDQVRTTELNKKKLEKQKKEETAKSPQRVG
ncbi:MAG: tetratricopeptide repeat protein [Pyrinomonadaceae bacterium]